MKIILVGSGRMGTFIDDLAITAGDEVVRTFNENNISKLKAGEIEADVLIDFSVPGALDIISEYVKETGIALVSGTTGYSEEEVERVYALGEVAPVLYNANYSMGIAIMKKMLSQYSNMLLTQGFDVELVETHHNKKVDSPSGTAKALIECIDPGENLEHVYGRAGMCGARDKKEIGIHAVRGGTIAGTHTVTFFGEDESIEITHTATSRKIFAAGAINAARKLYCRANGIYDFNDILFN